MEENLNKLAITGLGGSAKADGLRDVFLRGTDLEQGSDEDIYGDGAIRRFHFCHAGLTGAQMTGSFGFGELPTSAQVPIVSIRFFCDSRL